MHLFFRISFDKSKSCLQTWTKGKIVGSHLEIVTTILAWIQVLIEMKTTTKGDVPIITSADVTVMRVFIKLIFKCHYVAIHISQGFLDTTQTIFYIR